ncbi:MAG: hypothetical protein JWM16_475 [Verrucomicrobiales bacterium]|nr:hypothetical protein [Verrucomicrobiales bacterium]
MTIDPYYARFGALEPQIAVPARSDVGLIVVIPCYNEPNLRASLEALWSCLRPGCAVEVITVINSASDASAEIVSQNQKTLDEAQRWAESRQDPRFTFHFLHCPALPPKQAGVGLARKIGMDEAARRFDAIRRPNGVIVCFDADSLCESNYLCAIEQHFEQDPRTPGCSIYFEHPLEGDLPAQVYEAITLYELHLRYYVQALRFAGFPYAYHTIGSSMVVRANVYKKQGGMNKRQAGEDFYFLHKVIPLGGFTDLTTTRVIPSPRCSDRVPFGTGKAIGDFLESGELKTYPLEAFLDLQSLFTQVRTLGSKTFLPSSAFELPRAISSYLEEQEFGKALEEIESNTASAATFQKRFFGWFNGFQVMKFVHFARDTFYGERVIPVEARKLLELMNQPMDETASVRELLLRYRLADRHGTRM